MTPQQVSLAKRTNVDTACDVSREARRLLGANGILVVYDSMRHMANLESVHPYEGTHDIHTLVPGQTPTSISALQQVRDSPDPHHRSGEKAKGPDAPPSRRPTVGSRISLDRKPLRHNGYRIMMRGIAHTRIPPGYGSVLLRRFGIDRSRLLH